MNGTALPTKYIYIALGDIGNGSLFYCCLREEDNILRRTIRPKIAYDDNVTQGPNTYYSTNNIGTQALIPSHKRDGILILMYLLKPYFCTTCTT